MEEADGSGALRGRGRAFHQRLQRCGAAVSPEVAKQWQEELDRNVRRMTNLARLATAPEPKTGTDPAQEIYKRNKSRLYRYASSRTHRTPILFVPQPRDQPTVHLRPAAPAAPSSST
jgi:hypothetical protein